MQPAVGCGGGWWPKKMAKHGGSWLSLHAEPKKCRGRGAWVLGGDMSERVIACDLVILMGFNSFS